jgi:hypothetical protein
MNVFKIATVLSLVSCTLGTSLAHAAGTGSTGGGTGIYCAAGNAASFPSGYYALDYFLAQRNFGAKLVTFETSTSPIQQISAQLERTAPTLAQDLSRFLTIYGKKKDLSFEFDDPVIWEPSTDGLVHLNDENLSELLPAGCQDSVMVVRREKSDQQTKFIYWPKVLESIEAHPEHLSWILVHEWLRNFITDSKQIRTLNLYLHSKDFFAQDTFRVVSVLNKLGLGKIQNASDFAKQGRIANALKSLGYADAELLSQIAIALHGEADSSNKERRLQDLTFIIAAFVGRKDSNIDFIRSFKNPQGGSVEEYVGYFYDEYSRWAPHSNMDAGTLKKIHQALLGEN